MPSTTPTEHRARKSHTCSLCESAIKPGRVYRRWRFFSPDGPGTVKVHLCCDARAKEEPWYYDSDGWPLGVCVPPPEVP